jgi:hypothetical protein
MLNARSPRLPSTFALIACALIATASPVRAVAPTAPTNLVAAIDGQNVTLTWTASANNPTQYTVLAGFGPGQTVVSLPVAPTTTSLSVTAPPGTYWVRVIASNADGASAPSNEVVVAVGCAPGKPRNFRVMQKGAEGFLFWNPVAGATGYALQAGFGPGRTDVQFNLPRNTFNVLVPAGVYHTRVVALNGCGAGNASDEVQVNSPSNTIRVADPEPGTVLSLPDVQDLVFRFAAQNPPTLANSCPLGRKYDPNPWLDALVAFLRTYDLRFGYNAKPTKSPEENNGFPVIAAGDEIAYFRGSGTPMECSRSVYAIDVLFNHCDIERGGQPQVYFRDIAPEPAIWTGAGRFAGDVKPE